jgi:hypothetical protein
MQSPFFPVLARWGEGWVDGASLRIIKANDNNLICGNVIARETVPEMPHWGAAVPGEGVAVISSVERGSVREGYFPENPVRNSDPMYN